MQGQLGEQMRWAAEESLAEGAAQNFRQVKSHQREQDIRRARKFQGAGAADQHEEESSAEESQLSAPDHRAHTERAAGVQSQHPPVPVHSGGFQILPQRAQREGVFPRACQRYLERPGSNEPQLQDPRVRVHHGRRRPVLPVFGGGDGQQEDTRVQIL